MAISWGSWVEAQARVNGIRAGQQRADQIWGALEDAVVPAVGVHRLLVMERRALVREKVAAAWG